jgi:DNA-binding transcriptional MerR regulator
MFRIGQFSIINRITVKTLRYYDEIGLLKPSAIDAYTGYRMYTTDQLPRLQNIIALKQIGLSLSDIAVVLQDDGNTKEIIHRLEKTRKELEKELANTKDQVGKLSFYITALQKHTHMDNRVVIKDLPEVTVASLRKVIKNYDELFALVPAMGDVMRKHKVICAVPEYCFNMYHDGEYKEENIDVEVCEAVVKAGPNSDGVTYKIIPAVVSAACIYHKGPYKTLGNTYAAAMRWIEKNGYEMVDFPRESYIDGIWNKQSENEWLTEVQVPVKKK